MFTHQNSLGDAPAHSLFERISVKRKDGVEASRTFGDYLVTIDDSGLPEGVTLTRVVG